MCAVGFVVGPNFPGGAVPPDANPAEEIPLYLRPLLVSIDSILRESLDVR